MMRLIWRKRFLLLAALAAFPATAGDLWNFATPPSAVWRRTENTDWRRAGKIRLTVCLRGDKPSRPLRCSFFIETKQDWWFESRQAIILTGEPQTFELDLGPDSPDWQSPHLRRPYGPDVLRWVRSWGVRIFSTGEYTGDLEIGDLESIPAAPQDVTIKDLQVPGSLFAGRVNAIRFRLPEFRGDVFDPDQIEAALEWSFGSVNGRSPAYFRQDFIRLRRPGQTRVRLVPRELPVWQVNWVPRVPGTYKLKLRVKLAGETLTKDIGTAEVGKSTTAAGGGAPEPKRLRPAPDTAVFYHQDGNWVFPASSRTIDGYWHEQLDWTAKWGHYTGLGEFEQQLAWTLEQEIRRSNLQETHPILLFSEDELDDRGTYNWKDNPLQKQHGGTLVRPRDVFADAGARAVLRKRARYLWARYGSLPQVSGLLVLLNRPYDTPVGWVRRLAAELTKEFPGMQILCDNQGLPKRSKALSLGLYKDWTTDRRLSRFSFISRNEEDGEIVLEGRYPGSTAVVARRRVQHWAGARVFATDIHVSEAAGNEVKVMCVLRTDPDTVFQTRLSWLRPDDWNRVYFPLDAAAWTCLTDPKRTLQPWDLLNIREVALRFFCDQPNEVMLKIRNCRLLWPYVIETAQQGDLKITGLKGNVPKVLRYSRFELAFQLNRRFRNPYDPDEIDVSITLSDPAGNVMQHPGYYHEPWAVKLVNGRERVRRNGTPTWRIRFTPWTPGTYKWVVRAKAGRDLAKAGGTFTCTPSNAKGFVRIAKRDRRMFEFSDGSSFFPIGHNIRSPSDRRPGIYRVKTIDNADWADRRGTYAFERWFKKMAANGENYTRIWMCPWWTGLEWNQDYTGYHGLGYYNQKNAARLDRLLELAATHGIYVNLETFNHGQLSTSIDPDWIHNPLNRQHPGGFLRYASDFFSSPRALELHRRRLRYTMARWGYSPQIVLWGIITESEWVEAYFRGLGWVSEKQAAKNQETPYPYRSNRHVDKMRDWLTDTGKYIQTTDAHPHLVTTHFSNPGNGNEMWYRDPLQVVQNNAYTYFSSIWQRHRFRESNGVADVIYEYGRFFSQYDDRPLLIGEWGGHPQKNIETHLIAELHTGLWANYMTSVSGISGYWWWNLIDTYDLYSHFKALAAFHKGEDRRGKDYRSAKAELEFDADEAGGNDDNDDDRRGRRGGRRRSPSRGGLMLYADTELFAYIYNSAINRHRSSTIAKNANDPNFRESGKGKLSLPWRFENGEYRVEYWDTFAGKVIKTRTITVTDANKDVPIISHRVDLAIKVKPRHEAVRPSGRSRSER